MPVVADIYKPNRSKLLAGQFTECEAGWPGVCCWRLLLWRLSAGSSNNACTTPTISIRLISLHRNAGHTTFLCPMHASVSVRERSTRRNATKRAGLHSTPLRLRFPLCSLPRLLPNARHPSGARLRPIHKGIDSHSVKLSQFQSVCCRTPPSKDVLII